MIISIASGKGGTGKTFLATNLAKIMESQGVQVLDCDVEEPDDHLFLKPRIKETINVGIPIPDVDEDICIHCGKCSQVCVYHAITDVGAKVLVFPQMCHGCGACKIVCPVDAITEIDHIVGIIEKGRSGDINFSAGKMNIKEVAAPHLIRKVKEHIKPDVISLIDAPPGTTCPTVTAVSNTDYCILVTEPTPFGLNDLKLAVEMVSQMGVPTGVVINRVGIGDNKVETYCREEGLEILLKIPHRREIAEIYARGEIVIEELPDIRNLLQGLADRLPGLIEEVTRV
ncbi:MAG: ATP-binding protein [Candidatus Eremiobacteraeota bacterium]|nr:ATP-binding protein [Candidatus Eremiobacteraeota bacterium]